MPKRPAGDGERFSIGDYYLDQPHPDRGGVWYACRYDGGARRTRRRSLGVTDFEQAKIALAALVAAAPQGAATQGPPGPDRVLTVAILKAYLDGRATEIASEEQAHRAVTLINDYLAVIGRISAPVAFWTPAQQLEFAKWCRAEHQHSAAYIARIFNVMRSAFIDATNVKMRSDAMGNAVEAALLASAPRIVLKRDAIATALKIPARKARPPTLSLDQMAGLIDALETEHLFRFAIMSLATWARPQAVVDFDPAAQVDPVARVIDLAPPDWIATNKRRARQPITQCFAGWISRWTREDVRRRALDMADGIEPTEEALLVYKRRRVGCVKQAIRRHAEELGLDGFTQKGFRHFMTDQVKMLFTIQREYRSLWLGHVVRDGSRTTDNYESDDPEALADVALATDCILALLQERTSRPLFAIEPRLNRKDLAAIGARAMPKIVGKTGKSGGRDRDRTCDPYHVNVIRGIDFTAKPAKKRA